MLGTLVKNARWMMKCITSMPSRSMVPSEWERVAETGFPSGGGRTAVVISIRQGPLTYGRIHSCEAGYARTTYSSSPSRRFDRALTNPIATCSMPPDLPENRRASIPILIGRIPRCIYRTVEFFTMRWLKGHLLGILTLLLAPAALYLLIYATFSWPLLKSFNTHFFCGQEDGYQN